MTKDQPNVFMVCGNFGRESDAPLKEYFRYQNIRLIIPSLISLSFLLSIAYLSIYLIYYRSLINTAYFFLC